MDVERTIGQWTRGRTVGKHLPPRCTTLQKLEAKEKDGARTKEEAKEKETKEKGKDPNAIVMCADKKLTHK